MKHIHYCTSIENEEDKDILTRPNFDVNIRLFHSNPTYRRLIKEAATYIGFCARTEKEGYKKPHGWSGANAGIPFNIVAVIEAIQGADFTRIMLNPKIIGQYGKEKVVSTSCGSVGLGKAKRFEFIDVSYYDLYGDHQNMYQVGPVPGYTIQHEIEHTQGKLIRKDTP